MSDETKYILKTIKFLYLKRALFFIFEVAFIQLDAYLKKEMIWHVILFCT